MSEPETELVVHNRNLPKSENESSEPEHDDQNDTIEYQDSDDDLEHEKSLQEPSIFHQKYRSMKPKTDPEILKADLPNSNTFHSNGIGTLFRFNVSEFGQEKGGNIPPVINNKKINNIK